MDKDDTYFSPRNVVSQAFQNNTLKNAHIIDVVEMDNSAAARGGFEREYCRLDTAHFKFRSVDGMIEFYMTYSPGKMYDRIHFNVEKMKECYGGNFVISLQAVTIYKTCSCIMFSICMCIALSLCCIDVNSSLDN